MNAVDSVEKATEHRRTSEPTGCLASVLSALVTGGLLVVNGSFTLALLTVMTASEVPLVDDDRFRQFLLFVIPMGMVIVQWLMIDYLRRRIRLRRRQSESESDPTT